MFDVSCIQTLVSPSRNLYKNHEKNHEKKRKLSSIIRKIFNKSKSSPWINLGFFFAFGYKKVDIIEKKTKKFCQMLAEKYQLSTN